MVVQYITYLDMFAMPIDLNIQGKKTFRTMAGVWFTLLYSAIIAAVAINEFQSYFQPIPLVLVENLIMKDFPRISLKSAKILPGILFYNAEQKTLRVDDVSKYFTVAIQQTKWSLQNVGGQMAYSKSVQTYRMIPCKDLTQQELMASFGRNGSIPKISDALKANGFCPPIRTETFIQGNLQDDNFYSVSLVIKPCSLDSGCLDPSLITGSFYQLFKPRSGVNVSESESPVKTYLEAQPLAMLDSTSSLTSAVYLKEHAVEDYIGLLPKWSLIDSFFDFESQQLTKVQRVNVTSKCSYSSIDAGDDSCRSYFEQVFYSSGRQDKTKRKYKTIADTLGSIGGTNGVIVIIIGLLYSPINTRKRSQYLLHKVYSLLVAQKNNETEKKDKKKEKKESILRKLLCCCCKSKSDYSMDGPLDKKKIALDRIQDSLDVVNIVRDFNYLKVLVHFMLQETRHLGLAQLVGFDLWFQEKEREMELHKEYEAQSAKFTKVTICNKQRLLKEAELGYEYIKYKEWIDELANEVSEGLLGNESHKDQLTKMIDEYYHENMQDITTKLLDIDISRWSFLLNFIKSTVPDNSSHNGTSTEFNQTVDFMKKRRERQSIDVRIAKERNSYKSRDMNMALQSLIQNNMKNTHSKPIYQNNGSTSQFQNPLALLGLTETLKLRPRRENLEENKTSAKEAKEESLDIDENANRPQTNIPPILKFP